MTSKGQVTIPKKVRQELGIRTGSRVSFKVVGDRAELVVIDTPSPASSSAAGMLRYKRVAVPADFNVAELLVLAKRDKSP